MFPRSYETNSAHSTLAEKGSPTSAYTATMNRAHLNINAHGRRHTVRAVKTKSRQHIFKVSLHKVKGQ